MNTPFKIGYNAYNLGKSIDENFFDDGSDESLMWLEGWLEAERYDIVWRDAHDNGESYE